MSRADEICGCNDPDNCGGSHPNVASSGGSNELLTCPFCGGPAQLVQEGEWWVAECSAPLGAAKPCNVAPSTMNEPAPDFAVRAWNTRAVGVTGQEASVSTNDTRAPSPAEAEGAESRLRKVGELLEAWERDHAVSGDEVLTPAERTLDDIGEAIGLWGRNADPSSIVALRREQDCLGGERACSPPNDTGSPRGPRESGG